MDSMLQYIEVWRKIDDEHQYYEISNNGNVRSVDKIVRSKNNSMALKKGKVLKQYIAHNYYNVRLSDNNTSKNYAVHILVAKAFPEICGEWLKGCDVHHINGNKLDNRAENLIVMQHHKHQELHKGKVVQQFAKDGAFIKEWNSTMEIQKELGFNNTRISNVCLGKKYRHTAYGYIWKYK